MDYKYKPLEQDVSALSATFAELGTRLSEAVKDVAAGIAPSEKLLEQILGARNAFENVRNAVHRQAETMMISPLAKSSDLTSIHAIGVLLKTAASAEENKLTAEGERESVSAILSRVLAITHREMSDFRPLQDCLVKVGDLRNAISAVAWPNRHPEAESVIGGKHPSTALLSFVESLDTLEDEKWMALEATITEAYGKPLFVAASRGKLQAQAAPGKPPSPSKPSPAPEKPAEKKAVAERPVPAPSMAPPVEKRAAVPPPPSSLDKNLDKKEAPVAAERQQQGNGVPPPPVHVAAPPAPPAMTPAAVPPPPAVATPAAVGVVPPRPPAPPQTNPGTTPIPVPALPVADSAPPPVTSLSALATATEPAPERKPAAVAPADVTEKTRKEPRISASGPQPMSKVEVPAQEPEMVRDPSGKSLAGDGGQRPQRWGFWRGNR